MERLLFGLGLMHDLTLDYSMSLSSCYRLIGVLKGEVGDSTMPRGAHKMDRQTSTIRMLMVGNLRVAIIELIKFGLLLLLRWAQRALKGCQYSSIVQSLGLVCCIIDVDQVPFRDVVRILNIPGCRLLGPCNTLFLIWKPLKKWYYINIGVNRYS